MKSFETYRFKARLTKAAHKALDEALEVNRLLYNAANEERRYALQLVKSSVKEARLADGVDSWPSFNSQNKELTALRESDMKFANQARRIHIGTLTRLDKAWRSVWRNRKLRKKARLPRFKSKSRFRTIELHSGYENYLKPSNRDGRYYLRIKGLPNILFRTHRDIPEGQPYTIRITRKPKRVDVQLVYEVNYPDPPENPVSGVGVDMGVKEQATTSDGYMYGKRIIDRSRLWRLERKMDRQRRRAVKDGRAERVMMRNPKTGAIIIGKDKKPRFKFVWREYSQSYGKTQHLHQKEWQSITEREIGVAHEVSADIVKSVAASGGDLLSVEDLRIPNLLKNHRLARAISEQSWGRLITFMRYKAERAGIVFEAVNPRNTSQACAQCGVVREKKLKLSQRTFVCDECGHENDRDVNAAENIKNLALRRAFGVAGGEASPGVPQVKQISDGVGLRGRRKPQHLRARQLPLWS